MITTTLRNHLESYLAMRRALGYELYRQGKALDNFVRFAEGEGATVITTKLALRWARLPENVAPSTWTSRLALVRRFARYCSTLAPETEIPPDGLLTHRYQRKDPRIYSQEEVCKLLQAAKQITSKYGLRAFTYETLFGLLASTGLRITEALSLDDADIDLEPGILTIRNTKFGKTRCIPVHNSTKKALSTYFRQRNSRVPRRRSEAFFITESGTRLSYSGVRWMFARLVRDTGLVACKRRRPQIKGFRHTFTVETLLKWYRNGVDVEANLPRLSTYLGHTHVRDTYWYLSAVPELLCCALNLDPNGRRK
jgi:site-specific recombinase XerD